jgi:CRP-like cAMP-binding protein
MPTFTLFNNEPDIRAVPAGQAIFAEGDPGDQMYAVIEGEVEIARQGRSLGVIQPGGVFGEMALIDHQARSASAVAKTDCRVAAVPERRLTLLVSQNPQFALQLMRLLVERIRANWES